MKQEYAGFETDVSPPTVADIYMQCRQICYEYLEFAGDMLGGQGKTVEIDEAKLGR